MVVSILSCVLNYSLWPAITIVHHSVAYPGFQLGGAKKDGSEAGRVHGKVTYCAETFEELDYKASWFHIVVNNTYYCTITCIIIFINKLWLRVLRHRAHPHPSPL